MEILTVIVPVYKADILFWETYNTIVDSSLLKIIVIEKESSKMIDSSRLRKGTDYLVQESTGQYKAIHEAMMKVTTPYATWINAGDRSLFNASLLKDLTNIKNTQSIIVFNRAWHDENGTIRTSKNIIKRNIVIKGLNNGRSRPLIKAESLLFSTDLFMKSDAFIKWDLAGDYYLWKDLFSMCNKIYRMNYWLISFLLHDGRSVRYRDGYFKEIGVRKNPFWLRQAYNRFFCFAKYDSCKAVKSILNYEFQFFNYPLVFRIYLRDFRLKINNLFQ